jgi:hypothetical protein
MLLPHAGSGQSCKVFKNFLITEEDKKRCNSGDMKKKNHPFLLLLLHGGYNGRRMRRYADSMKNMNGRS